MRGWILSTALTATLLAAAPRSARACASCSCGDPTLTAMGTEQPFRNRLRASLDLRHRIDDIGTGAGELRLSEQRLDAQLAWAPVRSVFLLATMPALRREVSYAGDLFSRTSWGPGDAELRAKAFIYRDRDFAPRHLVALIAGMKLPTAPLERDDAGQLLPIEVQPGTGSFDPILGASYAHFAAPLSLYASVQAFLPNAGTDGYRASRSLRTTVAAQRQLSDAVAARLAVDTRLDGRAVEHGAAAEDSGGFIAFASPELLLSPVTDLTLGAYARISAINRLQGRHVEPYSMGLTVAYDF